MRRMSFEPPVIGQETICPDGLGRVADYKDDFPHQWIRVDTYVDNRSCQWDVHNVKLIEIGVATSAMA